MVWSWGVWGGSGSILSDNNSGIKDYRIVVSVNGFVFRYGCE